MTESPNTTNLSGAIPPTIAETFAQTREPASSSSSPPLSSGLRDVLLDVVDEVNHVRYAIYAAWMAAAHLDRDEHNAMQGILGPAGKDDRLPEKPAESRAGGQTPRSQQRQAFSQARPSAAPVIGWRTPAPI